MANTYQEFDGLEHSSANTRLETDIHGKVEGFISITPPTAKVTYPEVKVGGSAYAVAHGMPSGELGELEMVVRKSYLKAWEDKIRAAYQVDEDVLLELLAVRMACSLISEPYDDNGPLPTRARNFNVIYCGNNGGSDRNSGDALTCTIFLKQTAPAQER